MQRQRPGEAAHRARRRIKGRPAARVPYSGTARTVERRAGTGSSLRLGHRQEPSERKTLDKHSKACADSELYQAKPTGACGHGGETGLAGGIQVGPESVDSDNIQRIAKQIQRHFDRAPRTTSKLLPGRMCLLHKLITLLYLVSPLTGQTTHYDATRFDSRNFSE